MNPPRQEGWFVRNWKWFVPVGCLSMILMIVGAIGFTGQGYVYDTRSGATVASYQFGTPDGIRPLM